MLVSVLEDSNLAFNGSLTNMCNWLGISSSANNNKNLKLAIESLNTKGYIEYTHKGQKYIISMTNKGMEDNQVIRIRRCWVETIKCYKEQIKDVSIGWLNLLKVFVYVYGSNLCNEYVFKQQEIADNLNISKGTVAKALTVLAHIDLKGLNIYKSIEKEKSGDYTYNIGTIESIFIKFSD